MSRGPKAAGLLSGWLFLAGVATCQQYSFQYYGIEQGLTNLAVRDLYQDRAGYLWLSTEGGVYRFDGTRFRAFGAPDGLPFNVLASFAESADGAVLVATKPGLFRLNGDRFARIPLPGDPEVGAYSSVTTNSRGETYVGTSDGLWVAPLNAGGTPQWRHIVTPAEAEGRGARSLFTHGDEVWYACGVKFCRLNGTEVRVFETPARAARRWTSLRVDRRGGVWATSPDGRVFVLDRGRQTFHPVAERLPLVAPYAIRTDSAGRVLLSTAAGLAIGAGERFRMVGRSAGLIPPVNCVLQDRDGSLWIGLAGRGLAKWRGYGGWESFGAASGIDPDVVYATLPLDKTTILAGTESGLFVGRFSEERWGWTADPRFRNLRIRSLVSGDAGAVWLCAEQRGVARLGPGLGNLRWLRHPTRNVSYWELMRDRTGRFWVGTDGGAATVAPDETRLVPVEGLPVERVWQTAVAENGDVWFAMLTGLRRLSNGKVRTYTTADGLVVNDLMSITVGLNGDLWAGYRPSAVVSRIKPQGDRIRVDHFGEDRRGAASITYFVNVDSKGRLWAGTDRGVDLYESGTWTRFTRDDGLIWDDCNLHAFSEGLEGDVWIGTSGGLSRFFPGAGPVSPNTGPRTVFSEVVLGNKGVAPVSGLSVGYQENSLSIAYSALSFARERAIRFRYRLTPVSSEWRETADHELQFPGLPPGNYHLDIMARDGWGNWGDQAAQLDFEVRPPWWLTWWARTLYALAFLAIFLLLIAWRIRVHRRRLEAAQREREREAIVAAAKVQLESLSHMNRVAAISEMAGALAHEICQPLAAISGNASAAIELLEGPAPDIDEARQAVMDIAGDQQRATRIIERMRAGLRRSKMEAGPVDINTIVEESVRFAGYYANAEGVEVRTDLCLGLPPVIVDEIQMQQVLWNLIQNAVDAMAANPRGHRLVVVRTLREPAGRNVMVQVQDTGPGIPDAGKQRIFEPHFSTKSQGLGMGLSIVKSVVTLSGGRIMVNDAEGGGALFTIVIPGAAKAAGAAV